MNTPRNNRLYPDGSPGSYPLEGWGAITLSAGTDGTGVSALGNLGVVILCSLLALVGIRRFRD